MEGFILDASVALSWCFEDENTRYTDNLLELLHKSMAFVPKIWELEVANVLLMAEKKNRLTKVKTEHFLELVSELNITVEEEPSFQTFSTTINLARTHKLTAYDAAYLNLALNKKMLLATKDQAMQQAAIQNNCFLNI